MADLPLNDKLKQDDDQTQTSGGGSAFAGGGGGIISPGPVSTAGVGAGGTGGWTPIQAYLKANQGSTGTAQALRSEVGGELSKERTNLETNADKARSQAQSQVSANKIADPYAQTLIDRAQGGGARMPEGGDGTTREGIDTPYGTPEDQSKTPVQILKESLTRSYNPGQFNYGMGAKAQEYGSNLQGNQQGFNAILSALYGKASGGRMGSGMTALQNQLDQDNGAVNAARSDLTNQYKDLNATAFGDQANNQPGLVNQVNAEIGQGGTREQEFKNNQNALKRYLADHGFYGTPTEPLYY
jgi:hypothetical protein